MRVLITNNTLRAREGTELYVRDVAFGLLARGHVPICYSTELGEVAREIRDATIPVVDDLDLIGGRPDVIHGHHHLETVTALARFPDVPAIHVCHGWSPWEEVPPRFPRIWRYVAVSDACRDNLVLQHGIPEDRVTVLLSFVDLNRFVHRDPLPARPARALVFSNAASEGNFVPVVRAACSRASIALDVVGLAAGSPSAAPGSVLGRYDLVFAKGRAALEAAAVGCAVILCDRAGVGPMVTAADLDRIRSLNCGQRLLRDPLETEVLHREILRYDAVDAAAVSRRVRETAGHDAAVDVFVGLYRSVIEAQAAHGSFDAEVEGRALAAYVRWLTPRAKRTDLADAALEATAHLRAELAALQAEHRALVSHHAALGAEYQALRETATFRARRRALAFPRLASAVSRALRALRPRPDRRQRDVRLP